MTFRPGLLWEILRISIDTLRANKLRSALTILGVVIGVMSIVAMTSLIGGFSDQIRTQINQLGANTVYLEKAGFESFSSGRDFLELLKRPNLNEGDAAAIAASPLVARIDVQAGDFAAFRKAEDALDVATALLSRVAAGLRAAVAGASQGFGNRRAAELRKLRGH